MSRWPQGEGIRRSRIRLPTDGSVLVLALGSGAWTACGSNIEALQFSRSSESLGSITAVIFGAAILGLVSVEGRLSERRGVRGAMRMIGVGLVAAGIYGMIEKGPNPVSLSWGTSYEEGRQRAAELGRPLLVDFTADWCVACKEIEAEVFADPRVRDRLAAEFVIVQIDYDRGSEETIAAIQRFRVNGLPRVAFESAQGEFLPGPSFEGTITADAFLKILDQVQLGPGQ